MKMYEFRFRFHWNMFLAVKWTIFRHLVQIMAWRWPGDKSLFELSMVSLLTHICVTRPQWVNVASVATSHRREIRTHNVSVTITTFASVMATMWIRLNRQSITSLIARFMGPTRGPSGADRTQMGPMLVPFYLGFYISNPTIVDTILWALHKRARKVLFSLLINTGGGGHALPVTYILVLYDFIRNTILYIWWKLSKSIIVTGLVTGPLVALPFSTNPSRLECDTNAIFIDLLKK